MKKVLPPLYMGRFFAQCYQHTSNLLQHIRLPLLLIALWGSSPISIPIYGQELSPPPVAPVVEPAEDTEFHQIYLDKKAKSVKCIQYKEGQNLEGKISPDGKRVLIKGYTRRGRIQVDLEYEDGSEESIEKSPCFIDPVPTS